LQPHGCNFGSLAVRHRRIHGFASRPYDRFAFVGLQIKGTGWDVLPLELVLKQLGRKSAAVKNYPKEFSAGRP
jgi:hypothetical protein